MASKTDIELALAELEAGKFSFRMVETIKDHVSTLERDLAQTTSDYASASHTLRLQEYTISRLEADLRKANARMHALLKTNALTELTVRETKKGAVMVREYLPVARDQAVALSKKAAAYLSSVDYKAEFEKAKAHPMTQKALAYLGNLDVQAEWNKLKAHPTMEKALRELQPLLAKASAMGKEYLPVVQKQVSALIEKASAYIAELQKKAA